MRVVAQGGVQYLCLRPDAVPGLKPVSIVFIRKSLCDRSLGIRSDRRDFLEALPNPEDTIDKVIQILSFLLDAEVQGQIQGGAMGALDLLQKI